jgi:3-phosphoglycerate kinase
LIFAGKYILKKLDIEHPSDLGYGKGWDAVKTPFIKALKRLLNLEDKGAVLVSHAVRGSRKTKDGDEIEDIHPNLSGKILEEVAGAVDVIGYYHIRKGGYVLQIRPTDDVMAGCRLEENFNFTDGSPIKYHSDGKFKTRSV